MIMKLNSKERKEAEASYPIFQNFNTGMYGYRKHHEMLDLTSCKYDTRLKAIRARNEYYYLEQIA